MRGEKQGQEKNKTIFFVLDAGSLPDESLLPVDPVPATASNVPCRQVRFEPAKLGIRRADTMIPLSRLDRPDPTGRPVRPSAHTDSLFAGKEFTPLAQFPSRNSLKDWF